MPKRVIDFDAMWASDKLAACAEWAQAEYAWFYGLADASGSFELTNLRVIWGRVAAVRKNLSLERLEQVFDEFRDKGLLFVWEENGKRYAHWTGSDVPGRLPPPSWRNRLEKLAPPVPRGQLAKYLSAFSRSAVTPRAHSATLRDSMRESHSDPRGATFCSLARGALTPLKAGLEPPQAQEGDLERDWKREREEDEERAVADANAPRASLNPALEDSSSLSNPSAQVTADEETFVIPSQERNLSLLSAPGHHGAPLYAQPPGAARANRNAEIPRPRETAGLGMTPVMPATPSAAAPWTAAYQMFAIYAEERGALPEAHELTAGRLQKCVERLRAIGARTAPEFLLEFREAVRRAAGTPFLCGANERNWRATFDWLIANDSNLRKVVEGRYDAFARAPSGDATPARSSRDDWMQRELRVGLGPPGPHRVKPEALERDRLRREAERVSAGAKHSTVSAGSRSARPR